MSDVTYSEAATEDITSTFGQINAKMGEAALEAIEQGVIVPRHLPAFIRFYNLLIDLDAELTSIIRDYRKSPPPPQADKLPVPELK